VLQDLSTISTQITTDINTVLQDLNTVQTNLLKADSQLSSQINQGFGSLANLTIAGFTSMQTQQFRQYSSVMAALSNLSSSD
jgi:hypothetical protein